MTHKCRECFLFLFFLTDAQWKLKAHSALTRYYKVIQSEIFQVNHFLLNLNLFLSVCVILVFFYCYSGFIPCPYNRWNGDCKLTKDVNDVVNV